MFTSSIKIIRFRRIIVKYCQVPPHIQLNGVKRFYSAKQNNSLAGKWRITRTKVDYISSKMIRCKRRPTKQNFSSGETLTLFQSLLCLFGLYFFAFTTFGVLQDICIYTSRYLYLDV